jgi:hypothetical protein
MASPAGRVAGDIVRPPPGEHQRGQRMEAAIAELSKTKNGFPMTIAS